MYCIKPVIQIHDKQLIREYGKSFISYKFFNAKAFIGWYIAKGKVSIYPCKQCLPCINMKRYHWVKKCILERQCWKYTYFVTLTYNDDNLPNQLVSNDVSKFFKYLRFLIKPYKLRYLCAGEYGSKTERPHYHAIIFTDYEFDLDFLKNTWNGPLFDCALMNKAWRHKGFIWVAFDIDFKSFPYVVSYSNKMKLKQSVNLDKKAFNATIEKIYSDTNLTGFMKYLSFDLLYKPSFKPEFLVSSKSPPIGSSVPHASVGWGQIPSSLLKWWLNYNYDYSKVGTHSQRDDVVLALQELDNRKKGWLEFCETHDLYRLIESNKQMLEKRLLKVERKLINS